MFLCPNLSYFLRAYVKSHLLQEASLVSSYLSRWMKLTEFYCMDHCLLFIICAHFSFCFLYCEFLILRLESGSGSGYLFVFYSLSHQK